MNQMNSAIWCVIPLVAGLMLVSCRKAGDGAGDELAEAGYAMNADGWMLACSAGDAPAVKRFLDTGFDLETRDAAGDSGAHAAAVNGSEEVAKLLLDRGLPVDLRGANERTPLMAAVLGEQTRMVRWLLRQGADPKLRDADGFSPLMLAVREGHIGSVEDLAGPSRHELDDALLLAALVGQGGVIDALTSNGASVFARMNDGRTALMLAAQNGHADAAELLVELGASRFSTCDQGMTAGDHATEAGFSEVRMVIERPVQEVAMRLDSDEDLIRSMTTHVDQLHIARPDAHITSDPTVLLGGAVISSPPSSNVHLDDEPSAPPLVMRHYQQRELPLRIRGVDGDAAILEVSGSEVGEIRVAAGQEIPDSSIEVVRVGSRLEYGKINDGEPVRIAFIEVRDSRDDSRRTWLQGQPAITHEPAALVEDALTGRRYLAIPGQQFTAEDGTVYQVSDVRPNQLILIDSATGTAHTLPLRGPRG